MKKFNALLIGIIISSSIVFGQEDQATDTTKYTLGNTTIIIASDGDVEIEREKKEKKPADFNYWSGIDFGVNGYFMDNEFGFNNDPDNIHMELNLARSFNINLNVFEYSTEIGSEKVLFVTGLGFRFNRYAFKNTTTTLSFDDTSVFPQVDSVNSFHKNFLNTSYVSIPLMFAVVPGKDAKKSFHMAAGLIGSLRMGSRVKQRYEVNNQNFKDLKRGHYHINPFLVDASVRIGVDRFTIFANYGLTPLFERNKGPEYYPFAVGIASRI